MRNRAQLTITELLRSLRRAEEDFLDSDSELARAERRVGRAANWRVARRELKQWESTPETKLADGGCNVETL